jgi:uncharacterized protein YceK
MKTFALIVTLFAITGCKPVITTTATCDNGFAKEAEWLSTDKDTIRWGYPVSIYKIPDGVTCVIAHKRSNDD